MNTQNDRFQVFAVSFALFVLFLTMLFVIFILIHANQIVERNNAKNKVQLCILSISPNERDAAHTKRCYDEVEKNSGIKIERYGEGL